MSWRALILLGTVALAPACSALRTDPLDDVAVVDPDASQDAPPVDAGPPITIDGVVTDAEWAGAQIATTSVASNWGTGNQLVGVRAIARPDGLYIAVEGTVETRNAIVVFVDSAAGGVATESICRMERFTLDGALSVGIVAPASFSADRAWGTVGFNGAASDGDPSTGWRDVTNGLQPIPVAQAPTFCGASACETRIDLSQLGSPLNAGSIALFVRLTNNDVATCGGHMMSNQTLPMDNPADPSTVTQVLNVPLP